MKLIDSIVADAAGIATLRRDLHAHPELCFEEQRTSDLIAAALEGWGIPVHRGLGKTGVVGIVKNGSSARAVGLRADIDALPITEKNTFAHASRHAGRMHACGHDGHTAMLLAAAQHLATNRNFDGTVYLVFQPAEEGGGGAREMIQDGLFERFPMEAVFGAHNWPGLEAGQFAVKTGPVFASSNEFKVTIRGKGAHAAMPHNGIDPVLVACQLVNAWQGIVTRNKRPIDTAVISTTMIHAGEATNVIPDSVELQGTVRTFTTEVLDLVERRMQQVAEATCAAYDARCEFEFHRNYPPTINHPAETEFVRRTLAEVVGAANVLEFEPTMGAEDFSFYLQQQPGCYFVIGNGDGTHREAGHGLGPCMLHNPSYDFNDALIPIGASAWVRLAEAWLAQPRP
ncbi:MULTISPECIES: M20 aminoacylase family protein [unclassified Rubrivivax]|uniref:M20 aminoacylase family protein n=1 Tax=unclassified Rubrivivax TaxID=2649762 RepID=UPI001E3FF9E1|nr:MULTISPECIES: M20 aminoacylase family protein [unclassified Rubrivivax]MCC9598619.1 M20 family metallopeptidase [Rubrivivax sp. JA1055]MCC9648320.1 M20 family metallopeptidase [Rubrivivax sp. JA1029]